MINETTHFITYYHEAEATLAEQFIALLEDKYKEIQAAFRFKEATQKYVFYLCKNVEEYIEKTGKTKEEYQDWKKQEPSIIKLLRQDGFWSLNRQRMKCIFIFRNVIGKQ